MFRIFFIAVIGLGLASCDNQGMSLDGKWAWMDVASCEGDLDTIEFSGTTFTRHLNGELRREGRDLAYRQTDEAGSPRTTAIYQWVAGEASRTVTITFEQTSNDVLIYRGSTIDGQVPPERCRDHGARALSLQLGAKGA